MISESFLELLRCPFNPREVPLRQEGNNLLCTECPVRFKIKDGFPVLVKEEAELPLGCETWRDLPCQQQS
jgi:uncharacterized protein YbaR (Trm112 family)